MRDVFDEGDQRWIATQEDLGEIVQQSGTICATSGCLRFFHLFFHRAQIRLFVSILREFEKDFFEMSLSL